MKQIMKFDQFKITENNDNLQKDAWYMYDIADIDKAEKTFKKSSIKFEFIGCAKFHGSHNGEKIENVFTFPSEVEYEKAEGVLGAHFIGGYESNLVEC